jgi:hypothetical protein
MVAPQPSRNRLPVGRWVFANVVAFTAVGAIGGTLLRSLQQPYYANVSSMREAIGIQVWTQAVTWTIFGVLVGTAQWWAIRGHRPASWWLPATVLGWVVTGVGVGAVSGVAAGSISTIGPASVPPGVSITAVAAGILFGLFAGTPQWLVLRRHAETTAWWSALTLLGLIAGFGTGLAVARLGLVNVVPVFVETDFPSGKVLTVVSALGGAIYALVTGPALARTLSRIKQTGETPTAVPGP